MNINPVMPAGMDIIFTVFFIAALGILIWALMDIWKSNATQERKLLWTLLVVFVNPIGAIIWFAAGKKANK